MQKNNTAENLEMLLLSSNEINIVSDATVAGVQELLGGVSHITGLHISETDAGLVSAQIKTDCDDIYELSRAVFSAFAEGGAALKWSAPCQAGKIRNKEEAGNFM